MNNQLSVTPSTNFTSWNISKNTKKLMNARGELDALNNVLPEYQELGKKAKVTVYGQVGQFQDGTLRTTYGVNISPHVTFRNNPVTRFLGLSKENPGFSYVHVNAQKADENTFRNLFNDAISRQTKRN